MENFTPLPNSLLSTQNQAPGSVRKEAQPAPAPREIPNTQEIEVHKELAPPLELKSHMEVVKDTMPTTPHLEQAGAHIPETSAFTKPQPITLGLPDSAVVKGLQAPVTSSYRWLAELALWLIKAHQHVTLLVKGTKVVRKPLQ